MIYTNEKLIDPVAFVTADPTLCQNVSIEQAAYISGADYDVSIRLPKLNEYGTTMTGVRRYSPILGDLYAGGYSYFEPIEDRQYIFDWYPSHVAANALLRQLGREPGVDALGFTISPNTVAIPAVKYAQHISNGEFPRSDGGILFEHDRDDDHCPGVITMMPAGAKWLMNVARHKPSVHAAAAADRATSYNREIMNRIWPEAKRIAQGEHIAQMPIGAGYVDWAPIWGERRPWYRNDRTRRRITERATEHLVGLVPTLNALKAELVPEQA